MSDIHITNARIFDGSGSQPYSGEVLVEGNRIASVRRGSSGGAGYGANQVVDAAGAFLMPGMTEAHLHLSWNDASTLNQIQMMPPEEHALWCVRIAKRYLDMGFTSGVGAAAAKPRLDVVTRNAINSGDFPGPRYLAASQELTITGGLADETKPHLPFQELSFGSVVDGPEEVRQRVRLFAKYGVDTIKINLSGEYIAGISAESTPFSDEEVSMCVREAHRLSKRVAAHARSSESIKQCMRHGVDIVYHASFADDEALDLMEANKDKFFLAPGLGWLINTSHHAGEWGISPAMAADMGYHRELEHAIETMRRLHRRGVRILPGGDYGFAWMPHGTNARDLEHFVTHVGMSTSEALVAATREGGKIMMRSHELGQIREGYLADLLLVDGDPLADITVLQKAERLVAVMKDGVFHKAPQIPDAGSGHGD